MKLTDSRIVQFVASVVEHVCTGSDGTQNSILRPCNKFF